MIASHASTLVIIRADRTIMMFTLSVVKKEMKTHVTVARNHSVQKMHLMLQCTHFPAPMKSTTVAPRLQKS